MSENKALSEITENKGQGKVVFASEVIAIIAGLARIRSKGIAGMSGGVVEGFAEMLGRKNLTKGVKVEVGTQEAAIDIYAIVKYGAKIQDVAKEIQNNVKSAVETMTGLKVVEVNVYIQGVEIEKEPKPVREPKEIKEPEPPRVR